MADAGISVKMEPVASSPRMPASRLQASDPNLIENAVKYGKAAM